MISLRSASRSFIWWLRYGFAGGDLDRSALIPIPVRFDAAGEAGKLWNEMAPLQDLMRTRLEAPCFHALV